MTWGRHIAGLPPTDPAHQAWDDQRWQDVETAAKGTWEYERLRALQARYQDRPIAMLYAAITVSMLSVGVFVLIKRSGMIQPCG